jgi:hypothetical protein
LSQSIQEKAPPNNLQQHPQPTIITQSRIPHAKWLKATRWPKQPIGITL